MFWAALVPMVGSVLLFSGVRDVQHVVGLIRGAATLGARLFLRPPLSRTLGWMIHTGHDFPELMTDRLRSWDSTLIVKREADKPSTRGLLEYEDTTFGRASPFTAFVRRTAARTNQPSKTLHIHHLHPPVHDNDLRNTPLLSAKAYHYLETPQDMQTRLSALLSLRNEAGEPDRPFIVWEPAPYVCKPENLQPCLSAAQHVDVLSPNHLELAALFGESPAKAHDKATIEALARRVLDSGVGIDGKGTVVVRAGENGSVVVSRDLPPTWLPPFYPAGADGRQHSKVVDPTGAGNAFLGAYVVGYLQTQNAVEAACYGTVGGSFALEQVGMPELVSGEDGELWNGADAFERLREYRKVVGL